MEHFPVKKLSLAITVNHLNTQKYINTIYKPALSFSSGLYFSEKVVLYYKHLVIWGAVLPNRKVKQIKVEKVAWTIASGPSLKANRAPWCVAKTARPCGSNFARVRNRRLHNIYLLAPHLSFCSSGQDWFILISDMVRAGMTCPRGVCTIKISLTVPQWR